VADQQALSAAVNHMRLQLGPFTVMSGGRRHHFKGVIHSMFGLLQ